MARIASVALLGALCGGCDSFLDVNTNPNAPVNARMDVRFPALVTGMVHSTYYGDPALAAIEWTQQTSYNAATRYYDEINRYEVHDGTPNAWWNFAYASMLNETKLIMQEADPEGDAAYYGLAKFMAAWTWAYTTDLWGPIPFTEALKPSVPTPAYDKQDVVYAALDPMFDEAVAALKRAQANPLVPRPVAGDLLYGGDLSRWVKLARHTQARHRLRLVYAPYANAQAQAQAALDALQEGFTSNTDDADFTYPGGDGARNPLFAFQDQPGLFKASALTVGMLLERNDPRLPIMVEPALKDGVYRGHKNGDPAQPDSSISRVSARFTAENAPVTVASYAEAKFIEAEARLIVSGAGAADAPYRAAIRANMEKWGVASSAITTYLAARPSLSSVANPLEEIIREKYLANYMRIEVWHDWRRTGYPAIQPVPNPMTPGIPVRFRTPAAELANNAESVAATGIDPGLAGMVYKGADVWWGN